MVQGKRISYDCSEKIDVLEHIKKTVLNAFDRMEIPEADHLILLELHKEAENTLKDLIDKKLISSYEFDIDIEKLMIDIFIKPIKSSDSIEFSAFITEDVVDEEEDLEC